MDDTAYRLFNAMASNYPDWSKVSGRDKWAGILNGEARRFGALGYGEEDGGRQLISALSRNQTTVSDMVAAAVAGNWGRAKRIAHNQVSTFLKKERPLVSPGGTRGGGGGPGEGNDGGAPRGGQPTGPGTGRMASREYQTRYAPLDDSPILLLSCGADLDRRIDLQRAADKVLRLLEQFAGVNPGDAALLERKLVHDAPSRDLEREFGAGAGALRQRLSMARRRFHEFIGVALAAELRDLVARPRAPARRVQR